MISERQYNDMKFLIPTLQHISLQGNTILADEGYNERSLMKYIQKQEGTFIIPPKSNSKMQRECDGAIIKKDMPLKISFLK